MAGTIPKFLLPDKRFDVRWDHARAKDYFSDLGSDAFRSLIMSEDFLYSRHLNGLFGDCFGPAPQHERTGREAETTESFCVPGDCFQEAFAARLRELGEADILQFLERVDGLGPLLVMTKGVNELLRPREQELALDCLRLSGLDLGKNPGVLILAGAQVLAVKRKYQVGPEAKAFVLVGGGSYVGFADASSRYLVEELVHEFMHYVGAVTRTLGHPFNEAVTQFLTEHVLSAAGRADLISGSIYAAEVKPIQLLAERIGVTPVARSFQDRDVGRLIRCFQNPDDYRELVRLMGIGEYAQAVQLASDCRIVASGEFSEPSLTSALTGVSVPSGNELALIRSKAILACARTMVPRAKPSPLVPRHGRASIVPPRGESDIRLA